MDTWAFAVSRDGLGLSADDFWASTPRELAALRAVWLQGIERTQYMHASIQATLYNAHFDTGGVPFTADDLLGRGDRQKRKSLALLDKIEAMRLNASLARQRPGDTEGLPDWALEIRKNKGLVN